MSNWAEKATVPLVKPVTFQRCVLAALSLSVFLPRRDFSQQWLSRTEGLRLANFLDIYEKRLGGGLLSPASCARRASKSCLARRHKRVPTSDPRTCFDVHVLFIAEVTIPISRIRLYAGIPVSCEHWMGGVGTGSWSFRPKKMIPVAIFVARLLFSEQTMNGELQIDASELFPERALNKDQGGSYAAVVLQISTYFAIGGGYSFHLTLGQH